MTSIIRVYSLVTFLLSCLLGIAQGHGEYDSTYSPIQGVSGSAEFEYYYDIDHLIVKNGAFKFVSDNSDTAWTTVNEDQSWIGEYAENQKHGKWVYSAAKHELEIISIQDDHLEYDLRTIKTELNANYKHGVPDGLWISNSNIINKNEEPSFYEKIELTFKKGRAEGSFSHQFLEKNNSIGEITGQFSKGLYDGVWNFKYLKEANQIRETRYYTNGILTALVKSKNMGAKDSLVFDLSPETQKVLQSNEKSHFLDRPFSIEFNDGYPQASIYMQSQLNGNNSLRQTHGQLMQFDKVWLKKQKLTFGANRGRYPLSKDEEIYITQWFRVEQDLQFLVEEIKEHEIRDFGDSKDSIAQFTISWVDKQEQRFELLGTLSQIFLSKEIEYYYRDKLLLERATILLDIDSINYNNTLHIIQYEVSEEARQNIFTYLLENYERRSETGAVINESLSKLKTTSSVEDELERLPKKIAAEQARLDSIFKTYSNDKYVNQLLNHINDTFINGTIQSNFDEFKSTEDIDRKKILRDSILVDLNTVSQIYSLAYTITERNKYVDSLYTEYVFDAFTFSDNVPSRIKKKLYDQVQKIQTELIDRASESKTPAECIDVIQEIGNVQVVLIYLRDKQTKSLEKSIGRANSLDEKLKLLNEVL
jgi:hypothetical protein